ncbi:hypothetical protein JYU34_012312 [Plutella xylostella]|uniref:Uncharacterized protein n=1 Tax=Plutella xylostella TaxID=51655 RepID=A0ABQ7QEY2_PLUXY|nr:hypothetical protein JYU34_012312 [Plutella xylostella]
MEHGPPHPLLQLGHAPIRGEPAQPARHPRRVGAALRGAVQAGVVMPLALHRPTTGARRGLPLGARAGGRRPARRAGAAGLAAGSAA